MTTYDDKIVDGSSSSSSSSDWNSSSTDQQQQQRAFIVSMPAASPLGIPNVSTTLHAESDSVSNQGTTTTTSPLTKNSMNPSNGPQMFIASPMYNKLTAVFVEELKSGRNRFVTRVRRAVTAACGLQLLTPDHCLQLLTVVCFSCLWSQTND